MLPLEALTAVNPGIVSHVQLSLARIEVNVNRLSAVFYQQKHAVSESVDFYLRPVDPISVAHLRALNCDSAAQRIFTIADAYPLNGTVKSGRFKITSYIRPSHRKEIQQQIDILDEIDPGKNDARCLVIDFKDRSGRYDHLEDIATTESAFADFFRNSRSDNNDTQAVIHKLIKNGGITFFINEGSLKANLIKHAFTPQQADFFQRSEDGSRLLCQLCEVIMNGFKQGNEAVVNGHHFTPNDYIAPLNDPTGGIDEVANDIHPSIRLMTLYPNFYRQAYSPQSEYYRLITSIFKATHEDKNSTTIITIQ